MRTMLAGAALIITALLPLNARADVITDWNQTTVDEIRKLGLGPNPASRALAIAHIAAYEAINSLSKTHTPYRATLRANLPASPEAAAASAFHLALVLLFLTGFFELSFNSMAQALVQLNAPVHMRGRIVGVFVMSSLGMRTFSGVTVGVVGAMIGVHYSIALAACILFALILALFLAMTRSQPAAQ